MMYGIELAFGGCFTVTTNRKSKEIPMQVKEAVIRLKNTTQIYQRERGKTLGVVKPTA